MTPPSWTTDQLKTPASLAPWLEVERFDASAAEDDMTALELLAKLRGIATPNGATLLVSHTEHQSDHPALRSVINRPTPGGSPLWYVSFEISLELVQSPEALFELRSPGRVPLALPAPNCLLVDSAPLRRPRRLRRRALTFATALALSTAPVTALSPAASADSPLTSGHHLVSAKLSTGHHVLAKVKLAPITHTTTHATWHATTASTQAPSHSQSIFRVVHQPTPTAPKASVAPPSHPTGSHSTGTAHSGTQGHGADPVKRAAPTAPHHRAGGSDSEAPTGRQTRTGTGAPGQKRHASTGKGDGAGTPGKDHHAATGKGDRPAATGTSTGTSTGAPSKGHHASGKGDGPGTPSTRHHATGTNHHASSGKGDGTGKGDATRTSSGKPGKGHHTGTGHGAHHTGSGKHSTGRSGLAPGDTGTGSQPTTGTGSTGPGAGTTGTGTGAAGTGGKGVGGGTGWNQGGSGARHADKPTGKSPSAGHKRHRRGGPHTSTGRGHRGSGGQRTGTGTGTGKRSSGGSGTGSRQDRHTPTPRSTHIPSSSSSSTVPTHTTTIAPVGGPTVSGPDAAALQHLAQMFATSSEAQPPAWLIPIYKQAARRYHVPWVVLAAINAIETNYGRDLSISSAGAEGWMQFMPDTWRTWGVSANGKGFPKPYDPRDAIFSAARYLTASGARHDLRAAVFAYNHANWYVDEVLALAAQIAAHNLKPGAGARAKIDAMLTTAQVLNSLPYVWGGGHADWSPTGGYDCSGFVSKILHAGGFLAAPQDTQTLPSQPDIKPGPGKWVTIFDRTNGGSLDQDHVIILIDGQFWESGGSSSAGGGASVHQIMDISPSYLASFNQILHPQGL